MMPQTIKEFLDKVITSAGELGDRVADALGAGGEWADSKDAIPVPVDRGPRRPR